MWRANGHTRAAYAMKPSSFYMNSINMNILSRFIAMSSLLCLGVNAQAQRFYNLSPEDVKIETKLPIFACSIPLSGAFSDSVYTAFIRYPEFIDMSPSDVANFRRLSDSIPMSLPKIRQQVVTSRKQGALEVEFCPVIYREGKYQVLVSFMLGVSSKAQTGNMIRGAMATRGTSKPERYAAHSVLAHGKWAKIRVPATGVYQLTDALIRKAGFSDIKKVKVFGYGGNLQNETLLETDLRNLDDLKEVPTCVVGGRRLFHAKGPVSWSGNEATIRTRNPYSDYGYYFLTEANDAPKHVDAKTFLDSFYPSATDYHSLYEVDGYSWYPGGRNLFDREGISMGRYKQVVLENKSGSKTGKLSVSVTAGVPTRVEIALNGRLIGIQDIMIGEHENGNASTKVYDVQRLLDTDTVTIKTVSGGPARLDYVSMAWSGKVPAPNLQDTFPVPEYVHNITNQDLHAHGAADMVIIIPTSQKLLEQARRLADFHIKHDKMRVRVVPADEIFNEFSSGTPDANAYRRYLKMLYDRAQTEKDMPRHLLLFGDCVWDNRMLTSECKSFSPDDFLLCFESENSFSDLFSYMDDGFFCLLDDGEGANPQRKDKLDVAVGRFPVRTPEEAKVMVDKTIDYVNNTHAGGWQNTLVFMGDDGDNNQHMRDANLAADMVDKLYPGYQIKKVMWDAYHGESSAVGYRYPEVRRILKQQQREGALIMDYCGHGISDLISHEQVLGIKDFEQLKNKHLPLWITASCGIMPFDGVQPNIGESAVLNPQGGSVAFWGAMRTVYQIYNTKINMAYLKHVLNVNNGKPTTIGEAQRLAKNEMIESGDDRTINKLQYALLGDPAISLCLPTHRVIIDSINDVKLADVSANISLKAGEVVKVSGHIDSAPNFNGVVSAIVNDSRELVSCKMNASAEAEEPFEFYDRPTVLFSGSDSVRNGRFRFSFAMPMDINYSDQAGLMNIYAVNNGRNVIAHGCDDHFMVGGTGALVADTVGPKVYCYLNMPEFQNGGQVNVTPYFVAQLSDVSGINTAGNGIGHDLQLVIDGDASKTYNLNEYFKLDFGTYTDGKVTFSIPQLEPGHHSLEFRAWDTRNNLSTVSLDFTVVKALRPNIFSVALSTNPARESTTFIISHDMGGSDIDVTIDVFDMSGRLLWTHHETGAAADGTYTVDWNLTRANGSRLQTGVYLYRARLSNDGSPQVSKAKKLVVIGNK